MKETLSHLRQDLPAGIVVFLVALPLCLGIALASGAPLFSGLIAGIVGGIVVGFASGSHLSVSGPAAGLTVIVLNAITEMGTFESFLVAVVLAGIIQMILGFLRAGIIGHFFPSAVIKGMLSAIGLILILKQIPHALGDDRDYEGDDAFYQPDGENTFTEIILAIQNVETGALIISMICMAVLILWERPFMKNLSWTKVIPGPLVAVGLGISINVIYPALGEGLQLSGDHMVELPVAASFSEFIANLRFPDFSALGYMHTYIIAATIAIVASLETLLSLDAVDKLDPHKRIAPQSRELRAQGLGNFVSGLLGGLPLTAVIVRSSANVNSGAVTKTSAIFHGFLLISAVALFPAFINKIPLSALAAILLLVGFKLTKPTLYQDMWKKGTDQFVPFVITIVSILLTDLLVGICIGIVVGLFFVIKSNFHESIIITQDKNNFLLRLNKDVTFLNKALLRRKLENIPEDSYVIIDGTKSSFIDQDIAETLTDFVEYAKYKNITVEMKKTKASNNELFKIVSESTIPTT
ncbi:MAG: SulP family inorganic anion transporter [Cyclobacteriaceae bacterium]|nr:SulP family inorganic anion transporter [Cyclobacteriaceae bacterium HetDA_MAG_MS6]